jgi:ATP-binding cassette subfamily C protein
VGIAQLPRQSPANHPADATPSISVHSVSFAYTAGHDVLSDVSLDVASGERVALVGASGAGKTTLAKLLAAIHKPDSGQIRIGSLPIDDVSNEITGRYVALITQEVHVFAGTLADDLRLARPEASDEELGVALDRVGALEWVARLPQGMTTTVGEGAYRLTPGEAQQLALARLVLTDPPIAILDEATAEAGSAGARVLERSADAAIQGRTAIVVAHRLTQARRADRIVLLDSGRVIENGTHAELIARGGAYAALWAAWSDQRMESEPPPKRDGVVSKLLE